MVDIIKGKCGTDCATCSFKEKTNCKGCLEMDGILFWGECDIYKCAKHKGFEHCGMCDKLPCGELTHYIETGHNPNRLKNRDKIDGRPHAYMRKFGVSRINFRELAHKGQLPGVKKASW